MCATADIDCGVEVDVCGEGRIFEEAESAAARPTAVSRGEPVSAARTRIDLKMSDDLSLGVSQKGIIADGLTFRPIAKRVRILSMRLLQ